MDAISAGVQVPVRSFARPRLYESHLVPSTRSMTLFWEHLKKYLGVHLPLDGYSQVFLPPELLTSDFQLYAGLSVMSEEHLCSLEHAEAALEVRWHQIDMLCGQASSSTAVAPCCCPGRGGGSAGGSLA